MQLSAADILKTAYPTIVIPVNCKGVMGAGLALAAAKKFGPLVGAYRRACAGSQLRPGGVLATAYYDKHGIPRALLFAATKDHWADPSRLEWVEQCLIEINRLAQQTPELTPLALPQLGCGLGGLRWEDVQPLYERHLSTQYQVFTKETA